MTNYLLSIDPGKSTGVAFLSYTLDTAPVLVDSWQFGGGAGAMRDWIESDDGPLHVHQTIAEKFNARNTRGFSYTTDSLEPLRCEGVLLALGLMPDYTPGEKRWVDPAQQYLVGGKDKADKKKRQHRFLKESGFYRTGKDLNAPDADDFRSACSHGLAYLARSGHKPTFDLISGWE